MNQRMKELMKTRLNQIINDYLSSGKADHLVPSKKRRGTP